MKKIYMLIFVMAAALLITGMLVGVIMGHVERPKYQVVRAEDNIEVRHYDPMIRAETSIMGERKVALRDGFRLLADYIFGYNLEEKSIEMTAPVQQQFNRGAWTISFFIPSKYRMDDLPKPNQYIVLKSVPAKWFVVIRFSGRHTHHHIKTYETKLMRYIKDQGLEILGKPIYAFYHPPWTLPFMRRYEVMVEVKPIQ